MTMTDEYTPAVGDTVLFPQAPSPWNQKTLYTVAAFGPRGVRVTWGDGDWTIQLRKARAMGMTHGYTREQVTTALQRGTDLVDTIADAVELYELEQMTLRELGDHPVFTREEVTSALNDAADELDPMEGPDAYENSDTIRTQDVLNLAVNAVGHVLDHPGADLFEVIAAEHANTDLAIDAEEDLPDGAVPGDEDWNEALYKTVTGWIS
jgi:hypothetical protein